MATAIYFRQPLEAYRNRGLHIDFDAWALSLEAPFTFERVELKDSDEECQTPPQSLARAAANCRIDA
jgi:hypothetical protein